MRTWIRHSTSIIWLVSAKKNPCYTKRIIFSIFCSVSGASINPGTLKHVAKVCADVELSDHIISVIFTIFDEDNDGGLSNKEFISVMKNKLKRGLEKPKDTGLFNFFAAVTKCAKQSMKGGGGGGS